MMPFSSRSPNHRAALFAIAAFALFSTHDTIVKVLGGLYHPVQIVFFSVLFGFPTLIILQLRDRSADNLLPKHPYWTGLRTCTVIISGLCAFYAFTTLPLAQVYAILFATPLIITMLSIPVLGEKVGFRRLSAVCVGLIGVLIVIRPGMVDLTLGHLSALFAAIASGISSIVVRKIGDEERPIVFLIYPLLANLVVMGAALPFVYVPLSIEGLGLVAIMSLLGVCATRLIVQAYTIGQAGLVAPMQYSQIIWAAFYGSIFFAEKPDLFTALGASVIIASGIYIVMRENTQNVSETRPVTQTRTRFETGTKPRVSMVIKMQNDATARKDDREN